MSDEKKPNKLKSRKFWVGLGGIIMPIIAEVVTGAVGWPVAIGAATCSVVTYLLGQSHVDAAAERK